MPYKHGFGPFAGEVYRAPMAYPYRWPTGEEHCADEAFDAFVSQVHARSARTRWPPSSSSRSRARAGSSSRRAGWLARVAAWCRDNGIVFIADEIQTGFCRTGDWFACEYEGVVPDLITTAKGIAGGLPLAGVTGRAELMDAVHTGGLGGTYGGNPVACAAALGSIETMQAEDLCGAAKHIESIMLPRLTELAEKYESIGDVRGRGAMLAVEIVSDPVRQDARTPRRLPPSPPPATSRAWSRSPPARSATSCASCRRWSSATTCSPKASTSSARRSPRSDAAWVRAPVVRWGKTVAG